MQMPYNIYTVVQGSTLPAFLKNMKKVGLRSDRVELRADSIRSFRVDDVEILKNNSPSHSIFTYRHIKEGGLFKGDVKEQKNILKEAFVFEFDYIDVSLGNSILNELTQKERKKLLVSYHEYKVTPTIERLMGVMNKMRKESPAVIKIATMVNSPKDVFVLADLLKEKKKNEKLIVIGMGEMGKLTRIMFPTMGSYLTYASMEGEKIAPGLMNQKEMESVYNIITKSK